MEEKRIQKNIKFKPETVAKMDKWRPDVSYQKLVSMAVEFALDHELFKMKLKAMVMAKDEERRKQRDKENTRKRAKYCKQKQEFSYLESLSSKPLNPCPLKKYNQTPAPGSGEGGVGENNAI